ncbi:E3 ubiquitin-protein ligase HECTD4 [Mizuhopecten yessoensis]|uniref:E3 ubiquitin-protein ligase HECTD4 n=2 Tax=Mizuhopecten yessoensis TaxID=6573 RepID=A0A210QTW6_MIZYE|nr:E3 ubiquitin-protein ligase HECTD4 [Mizuhopecten yessoensis]
MSGIFQDNCQWLSVTEETLFLHDGLIRVTDLVELPRDVNSSSEGDNEVVTFDLKTPKELSDRLLAVCGTQNNAYSRLLEYRLNALRGYWNAQRQVLIDEQQDRDNTTHEETIALLKKQGIFKDPEQASFSTRISVLLVIPLLQSQSRVDPNLCGVTAELLLNCLRDCAPLTLFKEPGDCLRGLENLLCTWLGEDSNDVNNKQLVKDTMQRKNTAAALVALACARGHLKTFIHTVHLLQSLSDLDSLPVVDILTRLLETEGGQTQPTALLGTKHVLCWGFEDLLGGTEKEATNGNKDSKDSDVGRSITCDGAFLYTTNSQGKGLAKMGTGLHGSLRGYVYGRNVDLGPGKAAFGNGTLLYRPQSFDQEANLTNMCQLIDINSLQCVKTIPKPEEYLHEGPQTTIAFCSDATYFYWLWCPGLASDKSVKGLNVYLDVFSHESEDNSIKPLQARVILQKKDESSAKSINETLLSRLRPFRGNSSAATLVALTGGDATPGRKDDATLMVGSTSCGVSMKSLVKAPVYCDGSTLVVLTPMSGAGSNSSASRSLFGTGGNLSGFRLLASNMCFNVKDGQFNTRIDLTDAPTCSLGRGAPLAGLGVCFDLTNNSIWMSSNDWVDQFYNHGHQAPHHINRRLKISPAGPLQSDGNNIETEVVIKHILHHVGNMCLHQINNDLLHTPLGSYILQQHPADLTHMTRICHILQRSIERKDSQVVICTLIILQLIFKISMFKREREGEVQLLQKASSLVWHLLTDYPQLCPDDPRLTAVQNEACQVLTSGLHVLYPEPDDKNKLLFQLLSDGGQNPSLEKLRNMILIDLSEKLRAQSLSRDEMKYARLKDDLVNYILKTAVKESCLLLQESLTLDKAQFEILQASVPHASSCLRFMMALQSHLLREVVLLKSSDNGDDSQAKNETELQELKMMIITLASNIFDGSCQVLEVLLDTCNSIITQYKDDLECRLQGLERISKATILGHLLPVLLTTMTHANLRWLSLADTLMPKLVHLVVLTSQAALLLKSQVQAVIQEEMDMESDMEFIDLIGQTINITVNELKDKEEQGFLVGLKIPAPWSSGKALESIHPVRDNYKFKETVHIPGARCLYLRFDPRCSSQYDYDKLVLYAGSTTTAKKVAEYGGNTFGFGSRSVLGSGWPKDLVKVDGDSVTFSFEMRSGREHNTPDKAMWGFHVTVRAQESTEEVSSGLPFLADLALGLSVLACTMLQLLYHGPETSREEGSCAHLLKSKFLQRCVWQSPSVLTLSPSSSPQTSDTLSPLPRVRLPSEVLQGLRKLSKRQKVPLRQSMREILQPDVLEERIVSTVIKHLSLEDTVHHIMSEEQEHSDEFSLLCVVVEEVYRRYNTLMRQLQGLADLEQRWYNEVQEHKADSQQASPFFNDYHLQEGNMKELHMLCFVKDVQLDPAEVEDAMKMLRSKFDEDVRSNEVVAKEMCMVRTKHIVMGILSRLDLLLQVTITPHYSEMMTRTVSHYSEIPQTGGCVRSDTDMAQPVHVLSRSMSAPTGVESVYDETVLEVLKIRSRKRHGKRKGPASVLQELAEDDNKDVPPHVVLVDQLFSFIGSDPEKAISSKDFLSAAQTRWRRGNTRKQALVHMKELLTAASRVGGATHLVAAVTAVLQHGPCVEELTCGGMVNQVREAFAETMTSVVQLAAHYPIACCNSIGLLCIIPYTRAEEKCLVRSGLVHLLDKLCSLANHRTDSSNTETQSTNQKVSAMAWAGFQVLANRCVMWEIEDGLHLEQLEHSGLARQVSVLLTNHLARATECIGNEAAGTEALQDVLSLLNNLSRSRMGRAILSQPACVSKLLSLLLDQRPSPKLVLIILQLCRVALPLMSTLDCETVELPAWGQHLYSSHWSTAKSISDPPAKIVSLLLAKLGDFLVPGDHATICSRRPSTDNLHRGGSNGGMDKDKVEDSDIQAGRLSVFIHKREDQLSHEVIQPLLSSDNRPFRLGGTANMERVVRMDREMTKYGKAEVTTEDAGSALKKAAKWAQMGLVVSTGPPIDTQQPEPPTGDKKKTAFEVVCRERNSELARTDPVRPFISGHVANNMAAEVIALLHGLLTAPQTNTAQSWAEAVQRVLNNSLTCLPLLYSGLDALSSPRTSCKQLMSMAKLANAALCALGGFKEIIKPGCNAKVVGAGIHNTTGTVLSVSEQTGMATLQLDTDPNLIYAPRYSDTIQVPVTRLQPIRNEIYTSHQVPVTEAVVMAIKAILLPQDDNQSLMQQALPINGDGNSLNNETCRVVAELQTRACMVLASYLQDIDFTKEFIQHCGSTIDVLKSLAKDCSTGDRLPVIESHCTRLRLLYRDCAKPPPPPSKVDTRTNKEMMWDAVRTYPPVRACVFSSGMTGITFLGDPNTGSGLPRGTLLYANLPIPLQAPAFYWELEVCSFGDSQEEGGAIISFGFAPSAEKKDGAWTNPVGTCLCLNNGKAVHYNGASLLQWRSVRLDVFLNAGDIAGIGWERTGDAPAHGQTPRGRVYFTHNGQRLNAFMDDVSGAMYPVVHIQKKNTRIRANFGARPFAFAEGQQHRDAADAADDLTREMRESFGVLPFHSASDSDSDSSIPNTPEAAAAEVVKSPTGPPSKVAVLPKPQKEYEPEGCLQYKLFSSYDNFVTTGPDQRANPAPQDDESDEDVVEDDQGSEDHYALLVKAWEQKVFPVIRRRFRNEAERKDGLEQIRGALQLGMTDIARQTVEFLYEENGGIPRDLHLPTIDDIKEDLAKFTIERVKKGTAVVIRNTAETSTAGTTVLPKFAVRSMLRTFGLTGTVLDVDNSNELVQVETYLRSEGVLVRFWYPIDMLERPAQGLRRSTITGGQIMDTSNVHIHCELLRSEAVLVRMYCRTALLKLIDHCNSPAMELGSCSASLGSGMAASAALLQQLDIENLQLLSNELLCAPQPHGTIKASSLTMASSLQQCLSSQSCLLTRLLYCDEDKLKRELAVAIARAANQGEDYLIELTNQLCLCLQTSPEMFPYEEFPVTEVKVNTDINFPGAACLVVSCKTDLKAAKKDTSLYKSPWARVFSYTGHRVKKTGQATKQEVVSYPRDTSSTSNQNEQYTPAIVPCDRIHLRVGVSPPPGVLLTIHALPPQFLLAVAYIETLISDRYGCGTRSCGPQDNMSPEVSNKPLAGKDMHESMWSVDNIVITPTVFKHIIELVCRHLWTSNIPALIKEYMFHLLAQSLRILHYSEGTNGCSLPTHHPHLNPIQGVLIQLQAELQRLYEEETKGWPSATHSSGQGIGIGVSDKGRFSTYFQGLLEVNLAIAEVKHKDNPKSPFGPSSSSTEAGASSSLHTLGSPTSSAKKKKLKAKRDKERGGAVPKRTGGSPRVSESDISTLSTSASSLSTAESSSSTSTASVTPSTSGGSQSGTKPEDMLWFHRALTVSQILRCLAFREQHGEGALAAAVSDAAQVLNSPSAHNRLLVITGINSEVDAEVIKCVIRRASKPSGGVYKDEIFLPTGRPERKLPDAEFLPVTSDSSKQTKEEEKTEKPETSTKEVSNIKPEQVRGYAVISVLSRAKVEVVQKALLKCKSLVVTSLPDQEEVQDVPEEILSVDTVNASLIAEREGNDALEHYLQYMFFNGDDQKEISDAATLALIEIFHSCFIMEQKHGTGEYKQESGFICLGKDQILQNMPENLLCVFFNHIKPPKKSLAEQVMQVLRRYGMMKSPDKEMSPGADKNGKGKSAKKSPRSSKEKLVMGVVEKTSHHKDRKSKGKDGPEKSSKDAGTSDSAARGSKSWLHDDSKYLTLDGFLQYVLEMARQDVRAVWRALLSCGFDLNFERCACLDNSQAQQMAAQWSLDMDTSLVQYINAFCRKLSVAPSRLHPHEVQLTEADLSSGKYSCLQGVPVESVRLRFALLQSLNNTLETFFLPLVDLRPANTCNRSTAALLSKVRHLVFYDSKVNLMNRVLNATAQRKPDQAAPEIVLDPLETFSGEEKTSLLTWLCQAFRQLSSVPSSQFCVRLASGGDPTYSFNVRLTGEEVHGTSGSFRQFLSQVAKELQGSLVRMLVPCSSSNNMGKHILKPGPMTFPEERLLQFFGQLLGITMRADIPLGMDLLTCFWKVLVGVNLDPVTDLQEADQITYNYIKKIEMCESEAELQTLCADVYPRFVFNSLAGEEVELVPKGSNIPVCWENRQEYLDAIRSLRSQELQCDERVLALHCGLASLIPIQLLSLLSPLDTEIRTCGIPVVDLDFLKAHTMYQVGLMETDTHIEYFWNTLESLGPDDLCRFIKFSCNQERIPQTCPCKEGGADSAHVPPYPMKIAPPDGAGTPDSRYIRVETCMFMIKLPQYSSQEIMTQRLLYAINCREDPLSG